MRRVHIYILLKILVINILLSGISINIFSQNTGTNLPFFETLKNLDPNKVVKPTSSIPGQGNNASFEDDGVYLTQNDYNQFGSIYFKDYKFSSNKGLLISFEYMVYGGDSNGKVGGDGFSLFLFDASIEDPGIGAPGAGLGYTYNRTHVDHTGHLSPGLDGAYLGIGFDSYGNFKKLRYQGESRVNGIPFGFPTTLGNIDLPDYNGTNEVTLRGAMHPTGFTTTGLGKGYAGYPVLISQSTKQNTGFILKEEDDYTWRTVNNYSKNKNSFTIRGGKTFEASTDISYRKAFIELLPNEDQGFYVSVMVQHANKLDTIIYNYNYKKTITYRENALGYRFHSSNNNKMGDNNFEDASADYNGGVVRTLDAIVPSLFRIGFSAATGNINISPDAQKDYHVIKNLSVGLPRAAVALDDYYPDEICPGATGITFSPLDNDYAYIGNIKPEQEPCPECVDKTSFKFLDDNGKPYLEEDGITEKNPHAAENEAGSWRYYENDGTVVFKPIDDYTGLANIQYSIKGIQYNEESERSAPATIGVDIVNNPDCTPIKPKNLIMISNKMIRSRMAKTN